MMFGSMSQRGLRFYRRPMHNIPTDFNFGGMESIALLFEIRGRIIKRANGAWS